MKKIKLETIVTIAVVFAAVLIGAVLRKNPVPDEPVRYTASFLDVFNTKTEIAGYAESEELFKEQVELLKEKLIYYHELFDIYNSYEGVHNIKTINDHAGIAPVTVDPEIISMLELSKEMCETTDGKVNVAMGSVLSIWHEYRERGIEDPTRAKLPDMAKLQAAAEYMDISQLIIDKEASTVYLADAEMSLDVGGIGKGYAVQRVADYAKELGMQHLLISVGGNVCAIGEKTDGTSWRVGIQNPDLESEDVYAAKVDVKDLCVVTSGNYQRYYTVDGRRYCHIIDPETLMPPEHFASVTVLAEDSGVADALSTAVYNMTLEEGLVFVNQIEGVEAMWILEDGEIHYSEQFEKYLGK